MEEEKQISKNFQKEGNDFTARIAAAGSVAAGIGIYWFFNNEISHLKKEIIELRESLDKMHRQLNEQTIKSKRIEDHYGSIAKTAKSAYEQSDRNSLSINMLRSETTNSYRSQSLDNRNNYFSHLDTEQSFNPNIQNSYNQHNPNMPQNSYNQHNMPQNPYIQQNSNMPQNHHYIQQNPNMNSYNNYNNSTHSSPRVNDDKNKNKNEKKTPIDIDNIASGI